MFSLTQYSFVSQIFAFISLVFCLVSLVMALNCLWRSHKMLRKFIWFSVISVAVFSVRKVLGTIGTNELPNWVALAQYFDLAQSFFFMLAAVEFYRIIHLMDGETRTPVETKDFVYKKFKK